MTTHEGRARESAREYAAELLADARHKDITVFRYSSRKNNYPPEDKRSADIWTGYAVRFSTTDEEDKRIGGTGKFHDRSLVLFIDGDNGIPVARLWPHGRIIADIAGEEPVPMWLGWRSPFEDSDMYDPDRQTAGFKRSRPRSAEDRYPFTDGPVLTYWIVLDEDTGK